MVEIGKFRIRRQDANNIVVEEFRQDAKEQWLFRGYYSALIHAIQKVMDLSVDVYACDSLQDVIDQYEAIRDEMCCEAERDIAV